MTDKEFWSIINASLDNCEEDMYQDECLEKYLRALSSDEIREFEEHFSRYHSMADRGDLWAAGMLLNGGHGTDDGFEYFRNWLISCGDAIFFHALANPDSLAEVEVYTDENGRPYAEFEEFGYVASSVYREVTNGACLFEHVISRTVNERIKNIGEEISNWGCQDYEDEAWLKTNLPKLWNKYSKFLSRNWTSV